MKLIIFNIKDCNDINRKNENIYENFYQEKKGNNPERYNFSDYNGVCYGYTSFKEGKVDLSSISFKNDASIYCSDATIVWVHKNNIIAWYKNATVYNFLQKKVSYSCVGRDLYYNVSTLASDCIFIPKDKITFNIDINFKDKLYTFIEENDPLYDIINEYIKNSSFPSVRININDTVQNPPDNPIVLFKRGYIYLYEENNFLDGLKYFNTSLLFKNKLDEKHIIDIHYFKAICLQNLYCFKASISEYEKVLSYAKYDENIIKILIYLNLANNDSKKALHYCDKFLEKNTNSFLNEVNCLKIDCLINLEEYEKAKIILQKIIEENTDEKMVSHCKNILNVLNS